MLLKICLSKFFFYYSFIFYSCISCTRGHGGCWPRSSCLGKKSVLHPARVGALQYGHTEWRTTIYSRSPPPHTHTPKDVANTQTPHRINQQARFCSMHQFISLQKMESHFGHSAADTLTVTAFHHVHREHFKALAGQMRTFPQKICRGWALYWWDGNLPHVTFCYQTELLSQH